MGNNTLKISKTRLKSLKIKLDLDNSEIRIEKTQARQKAEIGLENPQKSNIVKNNFSSDQDSVEKQ